MKLVTTVLTATAFFALAGTASAQQQEIDQIQEIVVTAEKPMAATTLSPALEAILAEAAADEGK